LKVAVARASSSLVRVAADFVDLCEQFQGLLRLLARGWKMM